MTVLVTGATGKVGSRFVPRLARRGLSVRVMVRRPDSATALRALGVEVVQGDLFNHDSLTQALEGVETVVHLAAFFRGATPQEIHSTNVSGTEALAAAAIRARVSRLIFASSNSIFGAGLNRPAREDDPPGKSLNPYAASKVEAERILAQVCSPAGVGLRVLRFAFVYGEGDPHISESLPRFSSWNPARRLHMVHHADVGQSLLRAIEAPGLDGRTFNIADDAPVTVLELAESMGRPDLVPGDRSQPFDPWEMLVDTSRARRELGFRPIFPSYGSALEAGAV
ncbi:MAG: NAD-dependent epimerase/dehydratase family protein [Thermoplasmata archaeon]